MKVMVEKKTAPPPQKKLIGQKPKRVDRLKLDEKMEPI